MEQSVDQGLVLFGHTVDAIGELDEVLWWVVRIGRVGLVIGSVMVGSHGSSRYHARNG